MLHVHSVPHIWSSDIRSFWFYGQCLAPNYGPKHKFIHWIFFGNMVITALWSASVWSRRGPYIWNPVYYNLREVDNSLLLRHYFLSHFVREITVVNDLKKLQTSDCSRTCRRTALSSRSPSRRSRCGTGSCRDSYRRAKGPRRRPQEWIGSLASLGIMPGTPSILEVLNVAEGPLPFNLGRN